MSPYSSRLPAIPARVFPRYAGISRAGSPSPPVKLLIHGNPLSETVDVDGELAAGVEEGVEEVLPV